ncbi:unnamed protein product [Cladocopium goreaui]|uniref:Uncharacterized protein n=1 Tax=Cladocopium goreaui TaxID=2562237 RepID=A0A9P1DKH3_9DINO|nr:unnamed protein product [Cladocopium goreaui]
MGRAKGSVELVLNKEQVDEVCGYINVSIPETVKGAMGAAPEKTFNEYATKSKSLQKELICEHVWALKPLALVAPAMPVHNDSLFAVLRRVVGKEDQFTRKTWRKSRESMKGEKGWPAWVHGQPGMLDLFETMKPFLDDDVGKSWGIDSAGIQAQKSPCRKDTRPPSPAAGLGIDQDEEKGKREDKDMPSAQQSRQKILKDLEGKFIEILDDPPGDNLADADDKEAAVGPRPDVNDAMKAAALTPEPAFVEEVHKELDSKDIATAHPTGQKRLQADLKQPAAKSQPKKKAKSTHGDKPKFLMKKHKRKGQSGEIMVAAIHCNSTGKQVAQLSSNANPDCENLVGKMVRQLNEGKQTLESVIQELNDLKGS